MKQPKQNKAVQAARSKKKVACPTCGVLYAPGTGLAAHIRSKHGNAPQAQPAATNKAPAAEAAITVMPVIDPHTHLKEALVQLELRKGVVAQELARKDSLREESLQIDKRIEAIQVALKSWDQSMAASG